jgi:predicted HAD superfamily phosphohydrolase YqeG
MPSRRVPIHPVATWDDVLAYLRAERPATVVFDVEPLVAHWASGTAELDEGILRVVESVAAIGVQVIAFATNSLRRPTTDPTHSVVKVLYVAGARKPLRPRAYRSLPTPGVVIGDQLATDGILAWRLGYTLLHVRPHALPLGPRLMGYLGRPLRRLLFARREPHPRSSAQLPGSWRFPWLFKHQLPGSCGADAG